MTRTFNQNTNPYADDLVRLSLAPPERYSPAERQTLARIIASKLYELTLEAPFETDLGYSRWRSATVGTDHVEIHVVFESEPVPAQLYELTRHYFSSRPLIVLSVGQSGVVEVFNGMSDDSTIVHVKRAIETIHNGGDVETTDRVGMIRRRNDAEAAGNYQGRSDGAWSNGNRGNLPPGGGGGGDIPGDVPGSGGVGELIDHPVLFSVEEQIFDSILAEV